MELLVKAGLSPMDALVAATRTGAEVIGVADQLGIVAPGKLADVLILDANPLDDIRNIRGVRTVVLNGVPHERGSLDARTGTQNRTRDAFEALIDQYVADRRSATGNLQRAAIEGRIAAQKKLLEQVRAIDADALSPEQRIDHALLIGQLEGTIFDQEVLRPWEKNPELYLQYGSLAGLMDQEGEAAEKGRLVAARLKSLTALLSEAKANLKTPPRRFTESGIYQAREWRTYLEQDVAAFASRSGSAAAEAKAANDAAITALSDFEQFLSRDLLPVSTGSFAIGRDRYNTILSKRWYMKDDADALLAKGKKAFADTEALLNQVAQRMKPGASSWVEVYESLKDDHPPADRIKDEYQAQMDAARAYLKANDIVTLPPEERVITIDTPPAMRRSSPFGTFSSVGPFDKTLLGKLVLTPIEPTLSPEQRKERLRSHHRAWIPIIAVHEAYPGHHVQALKANENPRVLRRVVRESIFGEGWGLYCEELMYKQGFLKGDDVRLTQLRNRLWRAARVIIDVGLHTGSMTFEEGVNLLVDKVRFERYAAELEVGMYTRRPTMVLGYLIGMMEIADMRAAWERKYGRPAKPKEFFDRLLRIGSLPPSLVRAELLDEPIAQVKPPTPSMDEALGAAGLWRYQSLGRPTGGETKLDGLFVFHNGRFVQQSLNLGEPYTRQVAQAHAGTFVVADGKVRLLAEVGLVVNPTADTPLVSSPGKPHELAVARDGNRLVLTFGSGTVQKFSRVGPAAGRIVPLSNGALALVDGYFILVFEDGSRAVAGSGTYTEKGAALRFVPERWFTVREGKPTYAKAPVDATLDGMSLRIPGEAPMMRTGT
jgi:uncharacterized protein (DUF885 family)